VKPRRSTSARRAGAGAVFVSEPAPARRALVERLGFTLLDPEDPRGDLRERTGGDGANVVFDTAAHPAVAAQIASFTATSGRIVFVGTYAAPVAVDLQDVVFRELETLGCRVYTRSDMEAAVALLAEGRIDPAPFITSVVGLADAPAALEKLRAGTDVKVLIESRSA
jgi:threonine dehydrogenase-like Zn-dependent dehydrogenase